MIIPYIRILPLGFLILMAILLIPQISFSKDVTEKVINETPLDEQVSMFCDLYCLGNEKKGTVKSITVSKIDDNNYQVKGKAALQNRHVSGEPLNLTVYDRTIIVNSVGTLDPATCKLKVDDVSIENDFQNIVTNLLTTNSDVIGKVIDVPNCKDYLN